MNEDVNSAFSDYVTSVILREGSNQGGNASQRAMTHFLRNYRNVYGYEFIFGPGDLCSAEFALMSPDFQDLARSHVDPMGYEEFESAAGISPTVAAKNFNRKSEDAIEEIGKMSKRARKLSSRDAKVDLELYTKSIMVVCGLKSNPKS